MKKFIDAFFTLICAIILVLAFAYLVDKHNHGTEKTTKTEENNKMSDHKSTEVKKEKENREDQKPEAVNKEKKDTNDSNKSAKAAPELNNPKPVERTSVDPKQSSREKIKQGDAKPEKLQVSPETKISDNPDKIEKPEKPVSKEGISLQKQNSVIISGNGTGKNIELLFKDDSAAERLTNMQSVKLYACDGENIYRLRSQQKTLFKSFSKNKCDEDIIKDNRLFPVTNISENFLKFLDVSRQQYSEIYVWLSDDLTKRLLSEIKKIEKDDSRKNAVLLIDKNGKFEVL